MGLSKSKYVKGLQCPKMLWMDKNMPEQFDESVQNEAIMQTGNEVGDLAMGYYGDYVEIPFDHNNFEGMASQTQEHLAAATAGTGAPNICEATFIYEGNLCMVDILRVEPDGVHIVEVKATNSLKDYHVDDASYQCWLLQQCGLNVKSVGLMHLNRDYVRQGELDIQELFVVEDITEEVDHLLPLVEARIAHIYEVMNAPEEPERSIGLHCKNPHPCGYRAWCQRIYPQPSVLDLCSIRMDKALDLISMGVVTFEDVVNAGTDLNVRQMQQVLCEVNNIETHVDKEAIQDFLDGLRFPLYFLDFETMQAAIPPFDGLHPWQQVPTQYSLHILRENGTLEHREFLAPEGADPRRAVAEHLCADIPRGACTLAYYMSFERGRIDELAQAFPDLAAHLYSISDGMADLYVPFAQGAYYNRAQGGSNSIKYVLPALFPNDPSLDYHALEGVHNGTDAMNAYADLVNHTPEERAQIREQLLRYCELDTLAMVRIYEKLVEAIKEM